MSDEEDDLDILDDIKALEDALMSQDSLLQTHENADDDVEDHTFVNNLSSERTKSPETVTNNECDDLYGSINYILKSNVRLLETYKSALNAVNIRLDECIKRQQEVDYQIHLISRGGKANWRVPYFKARAPYFKDEDHFPAPPNDDQIIKQKRDELSIVYSRTPSVWSKRGRTNLWNAARANASLKYLEIMKSVNRNKNTVSNTTYIIPSDFSQILTILGDTELDWMRISVKDMKGRYSWQACKAMWDLHIKPSINRDKWRKNEDKMLTSLAKLHNFQNWDLIAKELGTERTCYQCFVRYNTINPPSSLVANSEIPWSPREDELIIDLIDQLRIGDAIPWTLVTFYLGRRTKNQIYCHWKYNLDPSLKKGRFTCEEDRTLLNAVGKYGTNFPRIASDCFPHRSSVQLSNRFHLLMLKTNESYNSWTIADDKRLLTLYNELGNNWSIIGNLMNKDRTYVRHRYAALTRRLSKGAQLTNLPRKKQSTYIDDDNRDNDSNIEMKMSENIDVQLMRYFHSVHTPIVSAGRKRKYHTSEQLEIKTKQLCDVLRKLNVNIDIPDDLDDIEELTPMDKQLLVSFKQSGGTKNVPKYTPDQIEEYRLKMFETNKLNDDTKHYIPPAPFGLFQNVRKKSSSKKTDSATVCNNCNLELIKKFDTPENIIKMMTDDELKIFDKFTLLVTQVCETARSAGGFEIKYVKPLTNISNIPSEHLNSQPESSHVFSADSVSSTDAFIEPCYSTLLGYQCLLNMQKIRDKPMSEDLLINERVISHEGKQAFHLLKKRFLTLFKYPIGMARVPIDYKKISSDDDVDVDECTKVTVPLEHSPDSPAPQYEGQTSETISDVDVSSPNKLSLSIINTLQKKRKEKNNKQTFPRNEL